MPGSSLGFDPYLQQGSFQPQPYYAAPQPQRPAPRPVLQQPRPQPRPASIAVPRAEPIAVRRIAVPPPEALGITLEENPAVVVPAPERLGIRLD